MAALNDQVSGIPGPTSATVDSDTSCRRCGYNLRTLKLDGKCPECGTAVELSTTRELLAGADPAWLKKLSRGAWLMVFGALMVVLALPFWVWLLMGGEPYLMSPALAAIVAYVIGGWMFTSRDPAGRMEELDGKFRRWARWSIVIDGVATVVLIVAPLTPLRPWPRSVWGIYGVAEMLESFLTLSYVARLAGRIPRPELSQTTKVLRWQVTAVKAIISIGLGLEVFMLWLSGVVALAALGIVYLVTMCGLGAALGRLAKSGETR